MLEEEEYDITLNWGVTILRRMASSGMLHRVAGVTILVLALHQEIAY
jgi:hypothetical protein